MKAELLVGLRDELGFQLRERVEARLNRESMARGGAPRQVEIHPVMACFGLM